jgi:hypothetical protein
LKRVLLIVGFMILFGGAVAFCLYWLACGGRIVVPQGLSPRVWGCAAVGLLAAFDALGVLCIWQEQYTPKLCQIARKQHL